MSRELPGSYSTQVGNEVSTEVPPNTTWVRAHKILSVGEVLWDLLPAGPMLGGAPANFALHAHALGADVRLISRVGDDDWGRAALQRLRVAGLSHEFVATDSEKGTGTVSVEIDREGQPLYVINAPAAWDEISVDDRACSEAAGADALCFGSLAQRAGRSRESILTLLAATPESALRVFDVNLREPFYTRGIVAESLAKANVVKLNTSELGILAGWFELAGDPLDQLVDLSHRFGLDVVALTRGPRGSLIIAQGQACDHQGIPTDVCDTVGAGDAFTAVLVLGLLQRWPLARISQLANETAAFVCSQLGATPVLPGRMRAHWPETLRG